jgi:sugar-phosphatase
MALKAVIFDMDGVLVDSEGFWAKAEMDVFSSYGVQITDDLAAQTKYMTTKEVTEFWYERFPGEIWMCLRWNRKWFPGLLS